MEVDYLEALKLELKDLRKHISNMIDDCPNVCDDFGLNEKKIEQIDKRIEEIDESLTKHKEADNRRL